MTLRYRLLGAGGVLMGGQVVGQACAFVRNIVVARLLSPEDFGVAATFGLAVSMFEMVSNLGVDRLLVQSEDGDDSTFQSTAHAFQVMRGVGMSLSLFVLAWPFSRMFSIPQALWAFQCIALVPLFRGFLHLDPKRLQREFGFTADVATELIPQIVLVLAAFPFVRWFEDYSAMLWLLVLQSAVMVAVSHAFAKRRYAWAWEPKQFNRMYAFGWPLLFNGLLMFFILQGDRMIVASGYDMTQLGVYSVAFSITFVPTMMIARVASALLLPLLARNKGNFHKFSEYYLLSICILCLLGVAISAGFILLGQRIVMLTYGGKYAGVQTYIGWMAIMQMIRVLRVGPTIASMSWGDTLTPLISNIGRISVFPIAIWLGLTGRPIIWVVVTGCMGELIALLFVVGHLHHSRGLLAGYTIKPMIIAGLAIAFPGVLLTYAGHSFSWVYSSIELLVVVGAALVAMLCAVPACRLRIATVFRSGECQVG